MKKEWMKPEMEALEISQTAGGHGHGHGHGGFDGFGWLFDPSKPTKPGHGGCGNGFADGSMGFSE